MNTKPQIARWKVKRFTCKITFLFNNCYGIVAGALHGVTTSQSGAVTFGAPCQSGRFTFEQIISWVVRFVALIYLPINSWPWISKGTPLTRSTERITLVRVQMMQIAETQFLFEWMKKQRKRCKIVYTICTMSPYAGARSNLAIYQIMKIGNMPDSDKYCSVMSSTYGL